MPHYACAVAHDRQLWMIEKVAIQCLRLPPPGGGEAPAMAASEHSITQRSARTTNIFRFELNELHTKGEEG